MFPFILKLVSIFKTKKRILKDLKELIRPIARIVRGQDVVYSEETQELILKHHPFSENTGFLPLIDILINANNELVHYQDDKDKISIRDQFGINMSRNLSECGLQISNTYREMMFLVEKEHYFLVKFFKPTLEEIKRKEKYRESWMDSLEHFGNLLEILEADLEYFYVLLNELKQKGFLGESIEIINKNRAIIKNNMIVSIQSDDFANARYWINYAKNKEWFDKEETETLNNLVFFIEQQEAHQLEKLLNSKIFKKIFNEQEILFFQNVAYQLKPLQILVLRPINCIPENAIDIVSAYHQEKRDALEIGKSDQCDIIIVDSPVNDDVQAEIMFARNKNKFVIISSSKSTVIAVNGNVIKNKGSFLEDGFTLEDESTIKINDYEFGVNVRATDKVNISPEDYKRLFENKILRLKREENAAQLAGALAEEIIQWDELLGHSPGISQEMLDEVQSALEEIEEVAPETQGIPEVKKAEKSGRKPSLAKSKKAKPSSKREALNHGLRVLRDSINLRKRIEIYRLNRIDNNLGEEYLKLTELLEEIEGLEDESPDSKSKLQNIKAELDSMLSDLGNAGIIISGASKIEDIAPEQIKISIFPNLWQQLISDRDLMKFSSNLLASVLKKRTEIELSIKNITRPPSSNGNIWTRPIDFNGLTKKGILALLKRRKNELQEAEQHLSESDRSGEIFDLKPTTMNGRRLWMPSRENIHNIISTQLQRIRLIRQKNNEAIKKLEAASQRQVSKDHRRFADFYNRVSNLLVPIKESLSKYDIKRKSLKFATSMMLVPLLVGVFPTKSSPAIARLKTTEQILRQINLDIKDPQVQEMLRPSLFVDELTKIIEQNKMGSIKQEDLPEYVKELISDGVLDIAVFVGAEREPYVSAEKSEIRFVRFAQSNLVLRLRYVDNLKDAKKAFEESDVIYVESHSRYGLGWALSKEGMGNPLKMQTKPIKIPKKELHGYKGPVLKDLGNEVIVQVSDEDIKSIKPRKDYQIITMASCESGKHFLEVMKKLRDGLPTTILYTTTDVSLQTFDILIEGIMTGKSVEQITKEMNDLEILLKSKNLTPYEALVINAKAGSLESKQYDKYNLPKSMLLFYDIEI